MFSTVTFGVHLFEEGSAPELELPMIVQADDATGKEKRLFAQLEVILHVCFHM